MPSSFDSCSRCTHRRPRDRDLCSLSDLGLAVARLGKCKCFVGKLLRLEFSSLAGSLTAKTPRIRRALRLGMPTLVEILVRAEAGCQAQVGLRILASAGSMCGEQGTPCHMAVASVAGLALHDLGVRHLGCRSHPRGYPALCDHLPVPRHRKFEKTRVGRVGIPPIPWQAFKRAAPVALQPMSCLQGRSDVPSSGRFSVLGRASLGPRASYL